MTGTAAPPLPDHRRTAPAGRGRGPGGGWSAGTVLAAAVVLGLSWGAATSGLQTVLPSPWGALANAVSPWVVPAFVVGTTARRPRVSVLAGILVCLGEVAGYYTTASLRGFGTSTANVLLWSVTALAGGPVFGVAGWLWRRAPRAGRRWPALGAALVAGVLLAEGTVTYGAYLHYTGDAVLFCALGLAAALVLGAGAPAARGRGSAGLPGAAATAAWLLLVLPVGVLGEVAMHTALG